MSGTVDVGVVTGLRLVLDVGGVDGDSTSALFGSLIDLVVRGELGEVLLGQNLGDGGSQRGFAVIDVTNRTNIQVRLLAVVGDASDARENGGHLLGTDYAHHSSVRLLPSFMNEGAAKLFTDRIAFSILLKDEDV